MELLLSITCFSFVVYIILLITLVRFRKNEPFSSAFFHLCIPLGITDLFSIVNFYLFLKLPDKRWYDSDLLRDGPYSHLMAKFGLHNVYIFGYWQTFGMLFLAINRFTIFVFPITYELIWEKWLKWAVIAQVAMPMMLVFPQVVLTSDADDLRYHCFNGTDSCFIVFANKQLENLLLVIANLLVAFIAVIIGILYTYMFYVAYKKRNNNNNSQLDNEQELKLALCGFVTFLTMACYSWSCFHLGASEDKHAALQIFYVTRDIYAWINPYLILACAKRVRQGFFNTVFCRSATVVPEELIMVNHPIHPGQVGTSQPHAAANRQNAGPILSVKQTKNTIVVKQCSHVSGITQH